MDEKIKENMEVFERSSFFSTLVQPVKLPSEAESKGEVQPIPERSKTAKTTAWEESEEPERTGSASWEKAEPIPARTSFEEQQVIEVERAVPQGLSVQQVSDEMERLSQRYGRGMEEWLYDQSAL